MSNGPLRRTTLCSLLLIFLAFGALGQGDGIYADFTTSMGSFTCRLEYAVAPKAVANFIGLATGQRAWLDLPSGHARTNAFYNGLTFHRVIAGFMIQGGSPKGDGTDGPGYAFTDEFSPSLRFTNAGVLALANSGPDSNGAQFFVTVEPTTWLNDVHTIFGEVISGTNVVFAINQVTTDANSKPLTNVIIQSIAVRRVGTAALAFNINAQSLPVVTNLPLRIANGTGQVSLTFSNRQFADNQLYSSTNLSKWTPQSLGIELAAAVTNTFYRPKDRPAQFFSVAQVQYASSTRAPETVYGRTVALTFTNPSSAILTNFFDSAGHGRYTFTGSPTGAITGYVWYQEPYRGRLWPISYSGLNPMTLQLNFRTSTNGSFTGTVYSSSPFPVAGTFTSQ